jgi:transcriptional regulator with XRE-family HTH domain
MLTKPSVGGRIREAREAVGMEREDLAMKVGVHKGSVDRWETDGALPTDHNLQKVADATGRSLEWLKEGRPREQTPSDAGAAGHEADRRLADFIHRLERIDALDVSEQEKRLRIAEEAAFVRSVALQKESDAAAARARAAEREAEAEIARHQGVQGATVTRVG